MAFASTNKGPSTFWANGASRALQHALLLRNLRNIRSSMRVERTVDFFAQVGSFMEVEGVKGVFEKSSYLRRIVGE